MLWLFFSFVSLFLCVCGFVRFEPPRFWQGICHGVSVVFCLFCFGSFGRGVIVSCIHRRQLSSPLPCLLSGNFFLVRNFGSTPLLCFVPSSQECRRGHTHMSKIFFWSVCLLICMYVSGSTACTAVSDGVATAASVRDIIIVVVCAGMDGERERESAGGVEGSWSGGGWGGRFQSRNGTPLLAAAAISSLSRFNANGSMAS